MSHHPNWKLRRLAPRVLRIIERHKDLEPSLLTNTQTLAAAAVALISTYDRLRPLETTRRLELKQSRAAIETLHGKMASCRRLDPRRAHFARGSAASSDAICVTARG